MCWEALNIFVWILNVLHNISAIIGINFGFNFVWQIISCTLVFDVSRESPSKLVSNKFVTTQWGPHFWKGRPNVLRTPPKFTELHVKFSEPNAKFSEPTTKFSESIVIESWTSRLNQGFRELHTQFSERYTQFSELRINFWEDWTDRLIKFGLTTRGNLHAFPPTQPLTYAHSFGSVANAEATLLSKPKKLSYFLMW